MPVSKSMNIIMDNATRVVFISKISIRIGARDKSTDLASVIFVKNKYNDFIISIN
jgi:hypothetical protein